MPLIVTEMKITLKQAKELTTHSDEYIRGYAERWVILFEEFEQGIKARVNILSPAAKLLTVDSQLAYLLESEEETT